MIKHNHCTIHVTIFAKQKSKKVANLPVDIKLFPAMIPKGCFGDVFGNTLKTQWILWTGNRGVK